MLFSRRGPTLPSTKHEIPDMAGTTTETAIRIMGRVKDRGIIRSMLGKTIIVDETKLRLLCEGPPHVYSQGEDLSYHLSASLAEAIAVVACLHMI